MSHEFSWFLMFKKSQLKQLELKINTAFLIRVCSKFGQRRCPRDETLTLGIYENHT